MNIKTSSVALIIALIYEIIFKLCRTFFPSFFDISFVYEITRVLSVAVGIIIIVFMYYFYKEEHKHKKLATSMKLLIVFFIIQFVLRLTFIRNMIEYSGAFIAEGIAGFIQAVLLFIVITSYIKILPNDRKNLKSSAVIVAIMFGISIVKSLFTLITYIRFMSSGLSTQFPSGFMTAFIIFFIILHVSIIWFLYNYNHWKKLKE